jgi:hypothetical protein
LYRYCRNNPLTRSDRFGLDDDPPKKAEKGYGYDPDPNGGDFWDYATGDHPDPNGRAGWGSQDPNYDPDSYNSNMVEADRVGVGYPGGAGNGDPNGSPGSGDVNGSPGGSGGPGGGPGGYDIGIAGSGGIGGVGIGVGIGTGPGGSVGSLYDFDWLGRKIHQVNNARRADIHSQRKFARAMNSFGYRVGQIMALGAPAGVGKAVGYTSGSYLLQYFARNPGELQDFSENLLNPGGGPGSLPPSSLGGLYGWAIHQAILADPNDYYDEYYNYGGQ